MASIYWVDAIDISGMGTVKKLKDRFIQLESFHLSAKFIAMSIITSLDPASPLEQMHPTGHNVSPCLRHSG
jgi:hypothetical protein